MERTLWNWVKNHREFVPAAACKIGYIQDGAGELFLVEDGLGTQEFSYNNGEFCFACYYGNQSIEDRFTNLCSMHWPKIIIITL